MPRKSLCCVPQCEYVPGTVRHRFPVYEEREFNIWVQRINNPVFKEFDDIKIYKNFLVCDKHFADNCRSLGTKKLNRLSLPTLALPGFDEEPGKHSLEQSVSNVSGLDSRPSEDSTNLQVFPLQESKLLYQDTTEKTTPQNKLGFKPTTLHETGHFITPKKTKRCLEFQTSHRRSRSTPVRKKKGLLGRVNVSRASNLTPKAHYIYSVASQLQKKNARLSRRCLSFKQRLTAAQKCVDTVKFGKFISKLNSTTRTFIESQIRNQNKHPKGYRFSTEDKILSLSLFKQSGKGYRLLSKIFALPSKKSIMRLLRKVPFKAGLNDQIFKHLKETVSKMKPRDKYCTLIFDEMSLSPGLTYKACDDVIEGFEDLGGGNRKPIFSDHAIVFMLRGIHRKWKQPISYNLVQSTIKTHDLVRCIRETIRCSLKVGLKVIATVCDQGSTNVSALNYLKKETNEFFMRQHKENPSNGFLIDGVEIVPLFDPPHLMKGIRNNLLTKNLLFTENNKRKIAKWDHIVQFYKLDRIEDDDRRMCPKLTDEHVLPGKIKKMKVKCCTQVFSQRVSSIMRRLAQWSVGVTISPEHLTPEAEDTADLLLFMDRLFDSVNGSSAVPIKGKKLRCAVTKKSEHEEFWKIAIKVLTSMSYKCPETSRESTPPSLKHWVSTLRGFRYLSTHLFEQGFKFVSLRNFNQDPVENFFGCIRSHGAHNVNPSSMSFISSFKSLIITNFMSSNSLGFNCEEDDTEGALDSLRSFIQDDVLADSPQSSETCSYATAPRKEVVAPQSRIAVAAHTYVTGFISKKIFALTKDCETCRGELMSQQEQPQHEFIVARRYSPKALCLPHTGFVLICGDIVMTIQNKLPQNCHKINISKILSKFILEEVDFSLLTCPRHDVKTLTIKLVIKLMIYAWITNVNRILAGKQSLSTYSTDPIKIQAQKLCNKYLKVGNKK